MQDSSRQDRALLDALRAAVGPHAVLEDPALTRRFEVDPTGRFGAPARAVVRPASTEEVSRVIEACRLHRAPLVVQGGNTGLVGGGVPRPGEVVLSTERLDELGRVDETGPDVVVGAGVVLARLQEHVRPAGFEVPVDHGGRGGATIGGMVATNAGGSFALRHGMTRHHLRGVEAVLADGRVVSRLSGLVKDNTGLDLTGLLAGSEGILAVITRVRLGLVPRPRHRVTTLLQLGSVEAAVELLRHLRLHAPSLEAVEVWDAACRRLTGEAGGAHADVERVSLLVQCSGTADPTPELDLAFQAAGMSGEEVILADATGQQAELWRRREAIPEALNRSRPLKLDVSVPVAALPRLWREVRRLAAGWEGVEPFLFGHLGDGNVHLNLLGVGREEEPIVRAVLELVAGLGGSISAEHGIGVAKAAHLGLSRSEAEIDLMRRVKEAFDPDGLLGPGRVLPPRS